MYMDFALMASDQIANQAAKWHYMSGGQVEVPLVIRASVGAGKGYGGQHSQTLESLFTHLPGHLRRLPVQPRRRQGAAEVRDPDQQPGDVRGEPGPVHGEGRSCPRASTWCRSAVANVVREGGDVTLVSWGPAVRDCLAAADRLAAEDGLAAEVVDLRSLVPAGHRHRARVGPQDRSLRGGVPGGALRQLRQRGRGADPGRGLRLPRRAGRADRCPERHLARRRRASRRRSCPTPATSTRRRRGCSDPPAHGRDRHAGRTRAMPHAILMPKPGQMTEECTVIAWHKREGDHVAKGDVLFEIETDKSAMEVEAFDEGVLLRIVAHEGATVPVNQVCAWVGQPGEAIPETPAPRRLSAPVAAAVPDRWRAAAGRGAGPGGRRRRVPVGAGRLGPDANARLRISPRASRAAADAGLDPRTITGTGPRGPDHRAGRRWRRSPRRDAARAAPARTAGPRRGADGGARHHRPGLAARRRRGGAAAAQPDAPRHRRPADRVLDHQPALHRDRRRGRHAAPGAPRGAQGRRDQPDRHRLRPGGHRPDPRRVPGRQLADRRRLRLAAPPRPPGCRGLAARAASWSRSSATRTG